MGSEPIVDDDKVWDLIFHTKKPHDDVAALVSELVDSAGILLRVHISSQRNLGLKECKSEFIWVVDDDMRCFPHGWALRMLHVLQTHPNCAICSPRLMRMDGSKAPMIGNPLADGDRCEVLRGKEVPTVCIAARPAGLEFDESFTTRRWTASDACRNVLKESSHAEFICIHDLRIVQGGGQEDDTGSNYHYDSAMFQKKWRNK